MESMALDEHLQPPPGQVFQLMPAPRQVPHQMAVKARRLQQRAPHMRAMIQSGDIRLAQTAPKAAPLRSKRWHCHDITAQKV